VSTFPGELQYQADIKKLQETEHQQKKEFEDFLNNFSAD
jgi:hypothetical protein